MQNFLSELNEYSVSRDFKQFQMQQLLFEKKYNYLKSTNQDLTKLINPTRFHHLKLDENRLEEAEDVSDIYPMSVEEEKEAIIRRNSNLEYLSKMNHTFEYCRTRCKVPDSRTNNITHIPRDNQRCLTDCMNVRVEKFGPVKPNNESKVFVWLV